MKGILLDENIPHRVLFTPALPVFRAVEELGNSPTDTAIWQYARKNGLVIVSKDADFSNRMMLCSPPPWVVQLRFGNLRRADFHALLAKVWPRVEALLPEHKLIHVHADKIEAVRG